MRLDMPIFATQSRQLCLFKLTTKAMNSIKFGDTVKDSVTGFEGILTGDANYLHGDRQLQVTGTTLDSDGCPRVEWFYATRIVAVQ